MQEARTWRDLLRQIISDNKEKQRLLENLNISSVTLTRWINGDSEPRPQNLRQLITTFPQYRVQLNQLMQEEKGTKHFEPIEYDEINTTIPTEFYERILQTRASTNEHLRFWSTCHLILQKAIEQLDPERRGMLIWVVRCMPPSGPYNKVRSLRECVGVGTPPWIGNQEQDAMFLGAESLAGNVVTLYQPGIIQNLEDDPGMVPATRVQHEKSAAIYPILYAGRIAGVLLVSSTEINNFLSQARTKLVEYYADLVALAFEPSDFYEPEQIALAIMPAQKEQHNYFVKFNQLVTGIMKEAASRNEPITNQQADMIAWQQLESELLSLSENTF